MLPVAFLQSLSLGLMCGMATGGLLSWLVWDAFWIGASIAAVPMTAIFLLLFLRLALLEEGD